MKIQNILLFGLFLSFSSGILHGQQDSTALNLLPGQVFGKIFTDFHAGLTQADRSSAFEVRRAYFGYRTQLHNNFSAEIKLDIGSPNDLSEYSRIRRYAYFKTAAFYHRTEKTYFKFGIIDIDLFALQEDYWGHRYIEKSMMDIHRFGDKADLGASFHYRIHELVSADITVMNGEGYRNLQRDNAFKTGLGLSVYPRRNLLIRFFADYSEKEEQQWTLASFLGYQAGEVTAGLEYNHKINSDFALDHNQSGVSGYVSYQLSSKLELFGRYDRLVSNILKEEETPWNLIEDGSAIITGVQFEPVEGLKAALNYQDWVPYAANMENSSFIYLNFEIKL